MQSDSEVVFSPSLSYSSCKLTISWKYQAKVVSYQQSSLTRHCIPCNPYDRDLRLRIPTSTSKKVKITDVVVPLTKTAPLYRACGMAPTLCHILAVRSWAVRVMLTVSFLLLSLGVCTSSRAIRI